MKNTSTSTILTDPFPTQQQFINHQSLHGSSSSSIDEVNMMSIELVHIITRYYSYDPPPHKKGDNIPVDKTSTYVPPPTSGLQIEKLVLDVVLRLPKSTICKSIFSPSSRVAY